MKSMKIHNKVKELDNQGNLIYDELQDIFKEIHNNKIYPPYDISLPIIQRMRGLKSQLDNIDIEVDKLEKEKWTACNNEKEEVSNMIQGLVDNAIEINEDGLIKHYMVHPREFNQVVFKDYYVASFFDYHKLLAKKYHYFVTFNNIDIYNPHESFYTNEPLDKLLEYYKDTMGFTYITDCTIKDFSEIKEYEILNIEDEQGELSYINHKYKIDDKPNYVVIRENTNKIYIAHYSDDKIFIGYQAYNKSPFITMGSYQYTYTDGCIQQHKFTLVDSQFFKSDKDNIDKLKKNLDRMLDKKYFGKFDKLNQILKDYYHI